MASQMIEITVAVDERLPLGRHISMQSCPAELNKGPCADEFLTEMVVTALEKSISAPVQDSAVTPLRQWHGHDVKVRNTFLYVEMENEDEEFAFLQDIRRRDTQSCPFFSDNADFIVAGFPASQTPCHESLTVNRPVAKVESSDTDQLMDREASKRGSRGRRGGRSIKKVVQRRAAAEQITSMTALVAVAAEERFQADEEAPQDKESLAHLIGKGDSRQERRKAGRAVGSRLWCHIFIDPKMLEPKFDLVKKLIGKNGCNTRGIFEATGTKIRVRGHGSGHLEERIGREAPVPLMVALAAQHGCPDDFRNAFIQVKELLQDVSKRFDAFLRQQRKRVPNGPRFWIGESSRKSLACLRQDDLDGVQVKVSS